MLTLLPPVWEAISGLLGLGLIGGAMTYVVNPPYRVKLLHTWHKPARPHGIPEQSLKKDGAGNIKIVISRFLRGAVIEMRVLDPRTDDFEDELADAVSKAERRSAALNATRKSILPRHNRRRLGKVR